MNATTKLVNPTDEQLNNAVAIHVAGWTCFDSEAPWGWRNPAGELFHRADVPRFTTSADAVLPFLEKHSWMHYDHFDPRDGINNISICDFESGKHLGAAQAKGFALTSVIALLRSHGAEVSFT